ncbi:hypothetical protein BGW41_005103 [Actinomortierella wolfii]|nr:hypothetical protein BGW41_005103 [Actinomortierella wolfii]
MTDPTTEIKDDHAHGVALGLRLDTQDHRGAHLHHIAVDRAHVPHTADDHVLDPLTDDGRDLDLDLDHLYHHHLSEDAHLDPGLVRLLTEMTGAVGVTINAEVDQSPVVDEEEEALDMEVQSTKVWGAKMIEEEEKNKKPVIAEEDKEKPNFGLSGALAEETNTVNGTVLKYNEPPEARKPTKRWRLYVFKDGKEINVLHIHRQSAFLFGRDRNVADIAIDHPSCSKQHAVLQFRQIVETDQLGQIKRTTKPFIIDLESANGTFVNGAQIPPTRYYELKLSDVLKFGASTREYVLLHEDADAA